MKVTPGFNSQSLIIWSKPMKKIFAPFTSFVNDIKQLVKASTNLSKSLHNLNDKMAEAQRTIDSINQSVEDFNHKNEVPLKRIAEAQARIEKETEKFGTLK